MLWMMNINKFIFKEMRSRILGGIFFLWLFIMLVTPKMSHSPIHHQFADMRNSFGVPNTMNVITNFPFLIVGVLGFVFCLEGSFFVIRLKREIWGWTIFYAGIVAVAFGSAYYHLKPEDSSVTLDTLPMMIAYSSLFSCLTIERVGERIGLASLFPLLLLSFISTAFERKFDDLRLSLMFQMIPSLAIPCVASLYPPKYTHSRYWYLSAAVYLLGKCAELADGKIYNANHHVISGHSLGHLCLVISPALLTMMLMFRSVKTLRSGDLKECP